jgi:DNA-binding GntR family transcriptional regulator
VELAEQLGVSRETVRLAAEACREGLLVKIRRKGTFVQPIHLPDSIRMARNPSSATCKPATRRRGRKRP